MIKKDIIAIVLARKNSKRVPNKNIRKFAGKSLLEWTMINSLNSKFINEIIISTDNDEVEFIVNKYERCTFHKRPEEFSTDKASSIDAILNILKNEAERNPLVILLQCTSPLRTSDQIDEAIGLFLEKQKDSLVSVKKMKENPFHAYSLLNESLVPIASQEMTHKRTQDHPQTYLLNGAIYISYLKTILKNKSFITPNTLHFEMSDTSSIDIDTEEDFKSAEVIFKELNKDII